MSYQVAFTLGVIALLAVAATLAFFVGLVIGRWRNEERDDDIARRAFEEGAGVDDKMRRIGDRAQRFGR